MTTLNDSQIRQYATKHNMIVPFVEAQLNPASYDICVGSVIKREMPSGMNDEGLYISPGFAPIDIINTTRDNPLYVYPSELIIVESLEIFNLPDFIACELKLKSSRARGETFSGCWSRAGAEWGDPGWNGSHFTIALKNWSNFHSLPIYMGMPIGQVQFIKLDHVETSYSVKGQYNKMAESAMPNLPGYPITGRQP